MSRSSLKLGPGDETNFPTAILWLALGRAKCVLHSRISFAASQQLVLAGWSTMTEATAEERVRRAAALLPALGKEKVGHRPNRCEPRAKKRRPKNLKLLMKPRAEARAELLAGPGVEDGE